ncbi:MAG TPA: HAD-IA family hydrolase, partial [Anaerolineaceae bacterium]|nr:HAD-IA family hydrolase [Anaerolineaceae bacterium]
VEFDLRRYVRIVGTFNSDVYRPEKHYAELIGYRMSSAEIEQMVTEKLYENLMSEPLAKGVLKVLDEAERRGIKTAVGSSSQRDWVEGHLRRFGLLERFAAVVTFDDVSESKPSPEIFQLALKRLGVRPENGLVLEDSQNGVLAAKRAEMRVVAVPNEVTCTMDFSQADEILESLEDLDLDKYFD